MFDLKAIRALTIDQCVERLEEIDQRLTELGRKHRVSRAEETEVEDLAIERAHVEGQRHRRDMERRIKDGDRSLALSGPDGARRLDGSEVHGEERREFAPDSAFRVPGRDQALRMLERSVRDDLITGKGAETIERQLGAGPLAARSWVSRWVTATGSDAYRSAFTKKALNPADGHLTWTPEEAEAWRVATTVQAERAMTLTDSAGGYLVPFQLDPTVLITSGGSINPLMQLARVETTVSDLWNGVSSAGVTAEWLDEAEQAADASPTLGQPTVPAYKAGAFVPWSYEVGMDATSFLSEVSTLLLDGLDQLTSQAFTLGSGIGQPTGVITAVAANGGSLVAPTAAETFGAADLYKVQNAAAPRFQANASWMMNLAFLNTSCQFETTNGALRFPELRDNPPRLLGRPVFENSHMDASINPAATESNHVVVYGDFKQFLITVRAGSTLELIPNLMGANGRPTGQRGGFLWARYGSDVLVPNAFRLLSIPTTA